MRKGKKVMVRLRIGYSFMVYAKTWLQFHNERIDALYVDDELIAAPKTQWSEECTQQLWPFVTLFVTFLRWGCGNMVSDKEGDLHEVSEPLARGG
jgi:hypothetical protein